MATIDDTARNVFHVILQPHNTGGGWMVLQARIEDDYMLVIGDGNGGYGHDTPDGIANGHAGIYRIDAWEDGGEPLFVQYPQDGGWHGALVRLERDFISC